MPTTRLSLVLALLMGTACGDEYADERCPDARIALRYNLTLYPACSERAFDCSPVRRSGWTEVKTARHQTEYCEEPNLRACLSEAVVAQVKICRDPAPCILLQDDDPDAVIDVALWSCS